MAFVPENDLERALRDAALDPTQIGKFYTLLLESQLFALGYAGKGNIQLAQIRHRDRIYHPIFSAPVRLQNYAEQHPDYFSMKGAELFASAPEAFFLLNPGWEYAKELSPRELGQLLQIRKVVIEKTSGEILITQPANFPVQLADALRKLFAGHREIEAAYLGQMTVGATESSAQPIIGIKHSGPWEPIAKLLHEAVMAMPEKLRFAAIPINDNAVYKSLGEMLIRYEPFYTRDNTLH